ncbi:MAG: hypothetical protein IJV64_08180 [Oscillospiraceae bacterium]|nr:hypothetical protein [Clostridia bacterium]MBQ9720655.1 hypothetical protein [Oscillospiraceae bacterium]
MRIEKIKIADKDYPIVYSTLIEMELEDEGTSVQQLFTNAERPIHALLHLLEKMIRASKEYYDLLGKDHPGTLTERQLAILLGGDDYDDILAAVTNVLQGRREVEAADADPNAQAAPTAES